MEKIRYFRIPETCINFLDILRVKKGECFNNRGFCTRESVFQHFHRYFCILSILSMQIAMFCNVEQIKNLSFRLKYRLLIPRLLKQYLLYILHQFFSSHTRVIDDYAKGSATGEV